MEPTATSASTSRSLRRELLDRIARPERRNGLRSCTGGRPGVERSGQVETSVVERIVERGEGPAELLTLLTQTLGEHGAFVQLSEPLGERPQDIAVSDLDAAAGGMVVGVQEPDHGVGHHKRCDDIRVRVPGLDDDRAMNVRRHGVVDRGGSVVGQQTGFQHELVQRDGAIDPLAEPGSLLVDEVRHPRPPGDAVDAREHRPPEVASSHQLLAGAVEQAVRARHRSEALDRGVAAGEPSGQHAQLVLDDLGATQLQIGE